MGNNVQINQEVNNSGQGKIALIPREGKRFNWGGFFFTWIWGLANNSYITLISLGLAVISFLVPFFVGIFTGISGDSASMGVGFVLIFILNLIFGIAGIVLRIWFGVKGNEWAWQNKRWQSIAHFNSVQKIWAIVGSVLVGVTILIYLVIAAITVPVLMTDTSKAKDRTLMLKSITTVQQAALVNEALENKCSMTSIGLAKCFTERLNGTRTGNKVSKDMYANFIFYGDGSCRTKNNCYVIIDSKSVGGKSIEKIHLYSDRGYVKFNSSDMDAVTQKYRLRK